MNLPRICSGCATASVSSGGVFDLTGLRARLEELETEVARPDLWDDRERAEKTSREKTSLERELRLFDELETSLDDAATLLELAEEADDDEARAEAAEHFSKVEAVLEESEVRQLLGGIRVRAYGSGSSRSSAMMYTGHRRVMVASENNHGVHRAGTDHGRHAEGCGPRAIVQ